MTTIGSDSEFRDSFLRGAARAFFVSAYADACDDDEMSDDLAECDRPGPMDDWYDCAPETPPAAYALAGELWANLAHCNPGGAGVYMLALRARRAEADLRVERDHVHFMNDDYQLPQIDAEAFGRLLAMEAMGHGVSWEDDHKAFPRKMPHMECSRHTFSVEAYRGE